MSKKVKIDLPLLREYIELEQVNETDLHFSSTFHLDYNTFGNDDKYTILLDFYFKPLWHKIYSYLITRKLLEKIFYDKLLEPNLSSDEGFTFPLGIDLHFYFRHDAFENDLEVDMTYFFVSQKGIIFKIICTEEKYEEQFNLLMSKINSYVAKRLKENYKSVPHDSQHNKIILPLFELDNSYDQHAINNNNYLFLKKIETEIIPKLCKTYNIDYSLIDQMYYLYDAPLNYYETIVNGYPDETFEFLSLIEPTGIKYFKKLEPNNMDKIKSREVFKPYKKLKIYNELNYIAKEYKSDLAFAFTLWKMPQPVSVSLNAIQRWLLNEEIPLEFLF